METDVLDAVVTCLNGRAEVLRNRSSAVNLWLAFRLRGRRGNRDAIGAKIRVVGASGREHWNHLCIRSRVDNGFTGLTQTL